MAGVVFSPAVNIKAAWRSAVIRTVTRNVGQSIDATGADLLLTVASHLAAGRGSQAAKANDGHRHRCENYSSHVSPPRLFVALDGPVLTFENATLRLAAQIECAF